jgi:hypothetical protein
MVLRNIGSMRRAFDRLIYGMLKKNTWTCNIEHVYYISMCMYIYIHIYIYADMQLVSCILTLG